jgi:hypothetical protein
MGKSLEENGTGYIEVSFLHFSGGIEAKLQQTCQDNLHIYSESNQAPPEHIYKELFFTSLLYNFLSCLPPMTTEMKLIFSDNGQNPKQYN